MNMASCKSRQINIQLKSKTKAVGFRINRFFLYLCFSSGISMIFYGFIHFFLYISSEH